MAVFESSEKLVEVLGGFFDLFADTPAVAGKLLASKITVRFTYSEPDAVILIDCTGDRVDVRPGDTETKAMIEMSMKADVAHKFWFGKVNLTRALTRRQIIAKGPIPKVLRLLPAIRPGYAMYPKYLDDNGYGEFNIH